MTKKKKRPVAEATGPLQTSPMKSRFQFAAGSLSKGMPASLSEQPVPLAQLFFGIFALLFFLMPFFRGLFFEM